ncbi:MAG: FAD-dependent oxidoreductase [Longimicrobiaceae bacterium]
MAKPVLLVVEDDPQLLESAEEGLRSEFGGDFRVLGAASGTEALERLRDLRQRGAAVALLLVNHELGEMSGKEFLGQALEICPDMRGVLYTDDAESDAEARESNQVSVDTYLLRPWDSPEVSLYPVLRDLLEEWQSTFRPPFSGVRVVGFQWSAKAHEVKDFLARNRVPYLWPDVERDTDARRLVEEMGAEWGRLPLLLFPDGTHLLEPTDAEIAEKIGLSTEAESPFYDLIIVGGGPSGLAAAVYGASEGLRTIIIEQEAPGGQAGMSSRIENYLGFPEGLSGGELAQRAVAQAKRFGVEILAARQVEGLRVDGPYRVVTLDEGDELYCHSVLLATGVAWRTLDAPGCQTLIGAGVYYGAASAEAPALRDEDVYLLGGGNSAGQAAMLLSRYARSVTLLALEESFAERMSQYLLERLESTPNVTLRPCCTIAEAQGEGRLETITIENVQTADKETVPAAGLYVFIGAAPETDWLEGVVARDEKGFILCGSALTRDGNGQRNWKLEREPHMLETSVPGVFVAGDVRSGSVKRVASAVGEGSMAIQFIHEYLRER